MQQTMWKQNGHNHWRLKPAPIYGWVYSVVVVVLVGGGLLLCQVLGITEMPTTRVFCYAVVFGLGHRLGWYRMS